MNLSRDENHELQLQKNKLAEMEILMARPINYLFCNYEFEIDDEILDATAEFNLISENQGGEFCHGREKGSFKASSQAF